MCDNEILLLRLEKNIERGIRERKELLAHLRKGDPRQRELARSREENTRQASADEAVGRDMTLQTEADGGLGGREEEEGSQGKNPGEG